MKPYWRGELASSSEATTYWNRVNKVERCKRDGQGERKKRICSENHSDRTIEGLRWQIKVHHLFNWQDYRVWTINAGIVSGLPILCCVLLMCAFKAVEMYSEGQVTAQVDMINNDWGFFLIICLNAMEHNFMHTGSPFDATVRSCMGRVYLAFCNVWWVPLALLLIFSSCQLVPSSTG